MRATTPLDADAARLHQKRTLVADVAEELAAFRQRCGRWLRNLRERISARAELPPRGMERSPRGASIIVLAYSSQVSSGRARVYRAYLHRYTESS